MFNHPDLQFIFANEHYADLLHEADVARQLRALPTPAITSQERRNLVKQLTAPLLLLLAGSRRVQ